MGRLCLRFTYRLRASGLTSAQPLARRAPATAAPYSAMAAHRSASRWKEAYDVGKAPPVVLEATHAKVLEYGITLEQLRAHALEPSA